MNEIIARLITRGGTAAQWTAANPILALNELGRETDTGKKKWGDGITSWNDLAYETTGGGAVASVTGSTVDNTDPANPVVNADPAGSAAAALSSANSYTDGAKLPQKITVSTTIPYTVTGVTALTIVSPNTFFIPAGTITGACVLRIYYYWNRITVGGQTTSLRSMISSTYDTTSAFNVQISPSLTTALRGGVMRADLVVSADTLTTSWNSVTSLNNDTTSSNGYFDASIDWDVDQYLIFTTQPTNVGESITLVRAVAYIDYI